MKKVYFWLRVFLSGAVSVLWQLCALVAVLFLVVGFVVSDSANVKSWILSSGVYTNVVEIGVNNLLHKIEKKVEASDSDLQLEFKSRKKVLVDRIEKQFPVGWIQNETERNIDAVYGFMGGSSDGLIVGVDLVNKTEEVRSIVSEAFKMLVEFLPKCAVGIVGEYEGFDLLSADCLPRNMSQGQVTGITDVEVARIVSLVTGEEGLVRFDLSNGFGGIKWLYDVIEVFVVGVASFVVVLMLMVWWLVPGLSNKFKLVGLNLSLLGLTSVVVGGWLKYRYWDLFDVLVQTSVSERDIELVRLGLGVAAESLESSTNTLIVVGLLFVAIGFLSWRVGLYKNLKLYQKKLYVFLGVVMFFALIVCGWSAVTLSTRF